MATNIYTPIRLTEQDAARLRNYLVSEFQSVSSGRDKLEQEWNRAIEDYEADLPSATKNFPFEGACNIIVPTIATTVDAIFAREINTVFSLRPLWSVQPLNDRWAEHAKPAENFLEWAQVNVMKMYDVCWPWYFEATKLGTSWVKMPWVNDVRNQITYLPDGSVGLGDVVHHIGPKPEYIPVQDVYVPDGDWDVQNAPWIGNLFRLTKTQLLSRGKPPFNYEGVDTVLPISQKDNIRQRRDQLEGFERTTPYELYQLMEVYLDFDINNDGVDESIIVTWDPAGESVKRVIYNYYIGGYRPFHKTNFMQREGRVYGIGVARMLRQLAEGITTQFRQFIDNATVANVRIWKARRGSGIRRGERVYPGKIMFMSDPGDLVGEQLGDVYNSQVNVLAALREASERRTGLSDVHLGIESPRVVNRMPATNMLSILQEGSRRFDLTIKDLRQATARIGESSLGLYQQFRPLGVLFNVLGTEGRLMEDVWRIPRERFNGQLAVVVTATSQANNRELEKQGLQQIMQALQQYYVQAIQMSQAVINPGTPGEIRELVLKIMNAQGEALRRLLQAYSVPDPQTFVPDTAKILTRQRPMGAPGGMPNAGAVGPVPGPTNGGAIPGAPPALAAILQQSRMGGGPGMAPRPAPGVPVGGQQRQVVGGLQGIPRQLPARRPGP